MLSYSARTAHAQAFLKHDSNDIDIYVEDKTCHNMWLNIVKNHLPNEIRLNSVIKIGSRIEVLEACKNDQKSGDRKKLYIIDGDYDFLLGRRKRSLKHLYRLRAYCIENLLITETALCDVVEESDVETPPARIPEVLEFDSTLKQYERQLTFLFIVYATVFSVAPDIPTVNYSIHRLMDENKADVELCSVKILGRAITISRAAIKKVGYRTFVTELRNIRKRAEKLNISQKVSGKDYLFQLFQLQLRTQFNYRGTNQQLKTRLAKSYQPQNEPFLARRLRSLLQ